MIRNRRKLLITIVILSILIGGAITFTTPNKLACRVYLALLNPDLETISIYLSEHQEVSSVYYASPSSAQNGSSLVFDKKIPEEYVESPYRSGSYGLIDPATGKYSEKLRIDPPTPTGKKGPEYSHYHLDGGKEHLSPNPKDNDPWK